MDDTPEIREKFAAVMWGVAEDFGGRLSNEGLKMRFQALQEYSIDEISRAGTWLLKNREKTFPAVPTTKEFIDAIETKGVPQISAKSRAEIQADEVITMLKMRGRSASGSFDDSITQHLMSRRWPYHKWAATVIEDEIKWWKKEFVEAYLAYTERAELEQKALANNQAAVDLADLLDMADKTTKRIGERDDTG